MKNKGSKMKGAAEWARRLWTIATDGPRRSAMKAFLEDGERLVALSGALGCDTKGKMLAQLIMSYHVVEKGLAMPARRLGFGKGAVRATMQAVDGFEKRYGTGERQAEHAAAVIRTYRAIHEGWPGKAEDESFWREVDSFAARHPGPAGAGGAHWPREAYLREKESAFPAFAASRHSVRNYGPGSIPPERLRSAVALAATAPSACNRQYVRVHCVEDKRQMETLLSLQNGNRGFGNLADKLLVVTADLEGLAGANERNDLFTNGGIFLMNLSYALHYHGVAHCILNCSGGTEQNSAIRKVLSIKYSENVVAILTCGEIPEEFDLAESPRKDVSELWVEHPAGD